MERMGENNLVAKTREKILMSFYAYAFTRRKTRKAN